MRLLAILLLLLLPAYAQAEQGGQSLAEMFAALRAAPDAAAAEAVEQRIMAAWLAEASPAVRLLLESGTRALDAHAPSEALRDFAAATTLQPSLADAWAGRGLARFALHDTAGATDDLLHALALDPQHFTAFETLSFVAEASGDWQGALAAWEKALALDPATAHGKARLEMLRRKVLGEST